MNEPDDFRGYDLWKCQSPDDAGEPRLGTVAHYTGHAQCLARINALTAVLEEIAAVCNARADSEWEAACLAGDRSQYRPNIWWQLLGKIRAVVPR